MKNTLITLILLATFNMVVAQYTAIPDTNFENALSAYDDIPNDGQILTANINTITSLDVSHKNIISLTGVEDFTELIQLNCNYNQINSLDLSQNTNLTHLQSSNNQLMFLGISANSSLLLLNCNQNQLTSLDVSQNINLTELQCSGNQLTSLNVATNVSLYDLRCSQNQLTSLDVSQNLSLGRLFCDYNQLTTINVAQNLMLFSLHINGNLLPNINVSQNISLTDLQVGSNQITNIDLSQNVNLNKLYCNYNYNLTVLDLSNNVQLFALYCRSIGITSLNLSQNPLLFTLECNDNALTSLDLIQNTALRNFECSGNQIVSLDLDLNTNLDKVKASNNNLSYFSIKNGNNNDIDNINFSLYNNPNLTCIFVDDSSWSNSNWSQKDINSTFAINQAECDVLSLDTDSDGVTDVNEINIYGTDPNNPDTDGGGVSDGNEVYIYGSNPLDPYDDDFDGDGFTIANGDCDDANYTVYPGAIDIPNNGIDEDCSGADATASIENELFYNNLSIYPNPTNNKITIKTNIVSIYRIFTINGQKTSEGTLKDGENELDIENLVNGVYFVHINSGNSFTIKKLIVQK